MDEQIKQLRKSLGMSQEKFAKEKIPFFVFHFNNPNSIKVIIDGLTRLHDRMLYNSTYYSGYGMGFLDAGKHYENTPE